MAQRTVDETRGAWAVVAVIAGLLLLVMGLTLALDTDVRPAGWTVAGAGLAATGLGLWLGGLIGPDRRLPPGAPLHAEGKLTLSASEAAAGHAVKVRVRVRRLCAPCGGTTWRRGRRCRRCRKTGLGRRARRTVTLRIPAGTRDGAVVRVRGEGTRGVDGVRPAGDLRVRVRVKGAAAQAASARRGERSSRGAAPAGGTITGDRAIVTADAGGFRVQLRRSGSWQTALTLPWPQLRRLSFDTAPHDEVIALYAWTTRGARSYALDAALLTRPQWRTLAGYVQRASAGSVTLDLDSRDRTHP